MTKRITEISIAPKLLVWARETIGKSVHDVATHMKLSEAAVRKLENGERKPTLIQLERLSNLYKRPLAVFFLPTPPSVPPLPTDFRTTTGRRKMKLSSKTLLVIRRARRLQSLVKELSRRADKEIIIELAQVQLNENPEKLADDIRNKIGVQIQTQISIWNNERQALDEWKMAIESLGIIVLQIGIPMNEVRGFSIYEENVPLIVINARDSVRGRIFTLFHELSQIGRAHV